MSLAGFSVGQYRSFSGNASIALRPLTILFGYNSAGKSTLLRFLPLLASSVKQRSPRPIDLACEANRGAEFRNLVSNGTSSLSITFTLNWQGELVSSAEFTITELPENRIQLIEKLVIEANSVRHTLTWVLADDERTAQARTYEWQVEGGAETHLVRLRFDGLRPISVEPLDSPLSIIAHALSSTLELLSDDVLWLRALRTATPRRSVYTGIPASLKSDGEGTAQALAYDALQGDARVFSAVSDWFGRSTGHSLSISRGSFERSELFSINVAPIKNPSHGISIVDTGEGLSQVLPIVTALQLLKYGKLRIGSLLAIEHPELHLHPAAHADIAGLFCDVARTNVGTCLVETHSENFLLRVQLEIARRELDPKSVAIYWIRQTADGNGQVDFIEYDNTGRPIGIWPEGVFQENIVQSREIVSARRRSEKK